MGTQAGGTKSHQTMRKKMGNKKYRQHMAEIGARGGKAKVPKGLSFTRKRAPYANELHEQPQIGEQA